MLKALRRPLLFLIVPLPSAIKIPILRLVGARIGKGCNIGLSLLDFEHLTMGDFVHIGHFNIIHRLKHISIGTGASIGSLNWITGASLGTFTLGNFSAITRLHFLEASGRVLIGANTIIAGRGSHFFTHGISAVNLDDVRPIQIGDWCYIGSSSRFVPGSGLARGTFLGMGSVVTKAHSIEYTLLAGAPATIKRRLAPSDAYFSREHLTHAHHPKSLRGCGDRQQTRR